jgi:hypothetical protein
MKFQDLYNRVYLKEQSNKNEVATPEDFNDVEPLPLPDPVDVAVDDALSPTPTQTDIGASGSSSLNDYITKIEDFANVLNGTDGSSLQTLVSKLDKVETPFEGIYSRTSAEIVDAAKTLRSVSEKLKNFIIYAAKR